MTAVFAKKTHHEDAKRNHHEDAKIATATKKKCFAKILFFFVFFAFFVSSRLHFSWSLHYVVYAADQDVSVRTSLDRTAMFVGDRVTYTIEMTCKRGVDVLADDVSRDKLKLEGLEVVDADTSRRSAADGGTVYSFQYTLTTYRVDAAALTIAPSRVRYAIVRAGQRLETAAPAGDVQVPGATIALRSALPDDPDPSGIRSDKPPPTRPTRFAVLQPIGIGLIIVSIVPAALAIASMARRSVPRRVHRSVRAVRHEERASLDAVRTIGVETVPQRRDVFTRLDALVREHLRDVCGVPGPSLTPADVPRALAGARVNVQPELVASLLATCELARYGPPHEMPSAEACRQAIEQADEIVRAR